MKRKDYGSMPFRNKAIDRISNGNGVSFSGENTSSIKKDDDGESFVRLTEDAGKLSKGTVIYIGSSETSGNYLSGGDYKAKRIRGTNAYRIK